MRIQITDRYFLLHFLLIPHVSFLRKRLYFWFPLSYSKLVWNLCCSDFSIAFLKLGQLQFYLVAASIFLEDNYNTDLFSDAPCQILYIICHYDVEFYSCDGQEIMFQQKLVSFCSYIWILPVIVILDFSVLNIFKFSCMGKLMCCI